MKKFKLSLVIVPAIVAVVGQLTAALGAEEAPPRLPNIVVIHADLVMETDAVSASIKGTPALRLGAWKYIPASGSGGWTKAGDQSQPVQLYNLAKDLGETRNLAAQQPERVKQMQELLESLIVQGRSTPGPKQKNDVEVVRHGPKP